MSRPAIHNLVLNEHMTLSECHPDGETPTINGVRPNTWWLYDDRAGMNIGMRERSRDEAFVEAIEYWAKRALKAEHSYSQIKNQVDAFVGQFVDAENEDD